MAKGGPVGDVQGMRRLADQLAAAAREIAGAGDQVHSRATNLEFEGPAARRLRAWAGEQRTLAQATKTELENLATYLRREAETLEQAQRTAVPTPRR